MNAKKNIALIFAQDEEMGAFLKRFKVEEKDVYNIKCHSISFGELRVDCYLGGIGKTAISFILGKIFAYTSYDLVLNVGVAGSISDDLNALDTLVATRCAYHDADVTSFGYEYGQMAQMPKYFECDLEGIEHIKKINPERTKYGLILSGDQFISYDKVKEYFFTEFDHPIACDMESAAVAQVCHMAHVPFMIIRTISDSPKSEMKNTQQYELMLEEACERAADLTEQYLKELITSE